jgi:hypothetical protein
MGTMLLRSRVASAFSALLFSLGMAAGGSEAIAAANLTIQTATIQSGRLIIAGTAAATGTVVKIDGTTFQAIANAQKQFAFNVAYRTPDCIIVLTSPTGALRVLIERCAPGVFSRGNWISTVQYQRGDLVSLGGWKWLALRANIGKQPGAQTSSLDWQLFASRGSAGPQGVAGPTGVQGVQGAQGVQGNQGVQGIPGPVGNPGSQGIPGSPGSPGNSGIFLGATIVTKTCTLEETYDYEDTYNDILYCIAACPVDKAAVTGWSENPFSEGGDPATRDPFFEDSDTFGEAFQNRFLVAEGASDEGAGVADVTVAIMCLPNVANPIPPPVEEP